MSHIYNCFKCKYSLKSDVNFTPGGVGIFDCVGIKIFIYVYIVTCLLIYLSCSYYIYMQLFSYKLNDSNFILNDKKN